MLIFNHMCDQVWKNWSLLITAISEIHFLSVRECCIHLLPSHGEKDQVLDHSWPGLLLQMAFVNVVKS